MNNLIVNEEHANLTVKQIYNQMNLVPTFIRQRIDHRPNLVKILDNIVWLCIDKVLRMAVGLFVSVWLARYLGPDDFGRFNYTIAFVGLFGAVASMGLNSVVVRDIVRESGKAHITLGSSFILQLIGSVAAFILIIFSISYIQPNDEFTKSMVTILGFSLIFKSSEVVKYWFESQVQSRYTVWVENSVFLLFATIKIAMILMHASLLIFVWVLFLEAVMVALGLFSIYIIKRKNIKNWVINFDRTVSLFKDAFPLLLMSLMLSIYTKIDLLMVEHFLGWDSAGLYAAAVRIAESWFFLSVVFVQSLYPSLIRTEQSSVGQLKKRLTAFYSFMFWFSCIASLLLFGISNSLFIFLYGEKYSIAIPVFQLYVWSGVFVFVITSSSRWFLLKNRNDSLFYRALFGAVTNVALNYWFIQKFGLIGASWATLISYFAVAYVYDIIDKSVREQLMIKVDAIFLPFKWLFGRKA